MIHWSLSERSKQHLVYFLIGFFIFFSLFPSMYEWNNRNRVHGDRVFELVHNFPTDYNFYIGRIRQGKEGAWLATEKYTSEPHAPSLSQILYVTIGRAWDFAHGQTPYVWIAYHTMRVFFAALLLLVVWKVAAWTLPSFRWQLLAFFLVATASTWPKFETVDGFLRFGGYMPWWSVIDRLQAITFLPHVLLGQVTLGFLVWVLGGGFVTRKTLGNYIFLGIITLIIGVIFPPVMLFVYGIMAVLTIWELVGIIRYIAFHKNEETASTMVRSWLSYEVVGRFLVGVISVGSGIYYTILFTQYPWKRLVEFDTLHPTAYSFIEYFLALGPTFPLGLIGLLLLFWKSTKEEATRLKQLGVWVVTWLAFLFIFAYIPAQQPTRFTQMAPHIPLGILTAYLFYRVYKALMPYIKKTEEGTAFRIAVFVPVVVVLFGFGSMWSSYLWQKDFVDHKIRATIPIVPQGAEVMYPWRDIIDGLTWLQIYTPRSDVVLTGPATGNYVPVYSGNTVYIGHANTVRAEIKQAELGNFYVRRLSLEEEMGFLWDRGIKYVFWGPEEQGLSGGVTDLRDLYPALIEVFRNYSVRIYQVPPAGKLN